MKHKPNPIYIILKDCHICGDQTRMEFKGLQRDENNKIYGEWYNCLSCSGSYLVPLWREDPND